MAQIGMFDSGNGGWTTLEAVRRRLPEVEIEYVADLKNCPYGEKSAAELLEITSRVTQGLIARGAKIVVIACNTATTRCIRALREKFPDAVFIGTEPALRLAKRTGAQRIVLLATPSTVASEQVDRLIRQNRLEKQVKLIPCAGLAEAVEAGIEVQGGEARLVRTEKAERCLMKILAKMPEGERETMEVVVLGCTHYVWIAEQIQKWFPKARMLDGNEGVARRVESVWEKVKNGGKG